MAIPNTSEKSNSLDREENVTRGNLSGKRVVLYTYDSNTDTLQPYDGGSGSSTLYESRFDTTTTANAVYLGKAVPGTSESDASWQIKKVDTSAGSVIFADDETTFSKRWDLRTTYTY